MAEHQDAYYSDLHNDIPHANIAHSDVPAYSDHLDTNHTDVSHQDGYVDTAHLDIAHLDGTYSDFYSANVADITKWILKVQLGVANDSIDNNSFDLLRSARTQTIGLYIGNQTEAVEIIRSLQVTGLFHLVCSADGEFSVKFFSLSGDTTVIPIQELESISITYDPSSIYSVVIVGYGKDNALNTSRYVYSYDDKVVYRFGLTNSLTIESLLATKSEAQALADFYLSQAKNVRKEIAVKSFGVDSRVPITGKAIIEKSVVTEEGKLVQVLGNETFRVKSISKNIINGDVSSKFIDENALIGSFHADSEHEDSYTDSYTDTAHSDVAHEDTAHSDVAHEDVTHEDIPHSDVDHHDVYNDHFDYADHQDRIHYDIIKHTDAHLDSEHQDVAHEDVPHSDSHEDSHSDIEHSDTPYQDDHTDVYSDMPHGDSNY